MIVIPALFYSCQLQTNVNQIQKPNVLLVFTDHQNVNMMSASGNPYVNTPAMDRIAHQGIMFKQAYCTSSVCGPAGSNIISGRMPHEAGVEWNGDQVNDDTYKF